MVEYALNMSTKQKNKHETVLSAEDKFFINLDEDLTLDVEFEGFIFTLTVPEMMAEATLSLGALQAARYILGRPDYADTLAMVKFPKFEPAEKGSDDPVKVSELDIDLDKLTHVKYAVSHMTEGFVDMMNNIAYLNIAVNKITYNGREVWIKIGDEDYKIVTFFDFVKYVRARKLRLTLVVDKLISAYYSWIDAIEVDPQEVKN